MVEGLVSVIVVNWNGERYLGKCLSSLMNQTYTPFEVVLVDNGSSDGSLEIAAGYGDRVKIVRLPQNRGFAAANNIGLEYARGEYIALLNNDAWADGNWLAQLVKAAEEHPQAAALASRMLDYFDRSILDGAGDGYTRMGWPDKIGAAIPARDRYRYRRKVLSACAGAALYRRKVLDELGCFDEDFFAYLEDVDLSLRINLAGYYCLYVPTAVVCHVGSATSGSRINPFTVYWSTRNYLPVIVKNLPSSLIVRYLPLMLAFQGYWIAACIRKGVLPSYLKGMGDALRPGFFRLMMSKRRAVRSFRRLSASDLHRRIVRSEKEILEGILVKRTVQGRPCRDVELCLRLLHGRHC